MSASDEAVEAAASALRRRCGPGPRQFEAEVAVPAATPIVRAQVAEEIALAIEAGIPALLADLEKGRASELANAAKIARDVGGAL